MKSKHFVFSLSVLAIATSVVFFACSKGTSASSTSGPTATQQSVSLYLTDGPGIFDKVNLNVTSIQVLVDTSSNAAAHDSCNLGGIGARPNQPLPPDSSFLVWSTLNFTAGTYDLLQLRNGVDTLLSTSNIPKGAIRLIRVNLGTNNTIVVDSVSYALNIPANAPDYILLQLKGNEFQHTSSNTSKLWLDFNVARSIAYINGAYYLEPVLQPFIPSQTGTIAGVIAPQAAFPELVTVLNGTDTAGLALPNPGGQFQVRGLQNGTYSVTIHSIGKDSTGFANFKDTTISNVVIQNANMVNLGIIQLHQ